MCLCVAMYAKSETIEKRLESATGLEYYSPDFSKARKRWKDMLAIRSMTSAFGHSLQMSWVHTTARAPPPQALFSLGIPRVPLNPSWFCVRAPKAHMSHPPPNSLAVGTHPPPSVPKPPEKQMMGVSQNKEPLHRVSPRIVRTYLDLFSIHWHNEWRAGPCDWKLLFFNELVHYCPTHVASATYHSPLEAQ